MAVWTPNSPIYGYRRGSQAPRYSTNLKNLLRQPANALHRAGPCDPVKVLEPLGRGFRICCIATLLTAFPCVRTRQLGNGASFCENAAGRVIATKQSAACVGYAESFLILRLLQAVGLERGDII